jgi:hypothetical protein
MAPDGRETVCSFDPGGTAQAGARHSGQAEPGQQVAPFAVSRQPAVPAAWPRVLFPGRLKQALLALAAFPVRTGQLRQQFRPLLPELLRPVLLALFLPEPFLPEPLLPGQLLVLQPHRLTAQKIQVLVEAPLRAGQAGQQLRAGLIRLLFQVQPADRFQLPSPAGAVWPPF